MDAFTERIKELLSTFKLLLSFIVNDIRTKPRTFKIGVFSVFVVVAFLVTLQSLLQLTPILFLKLAQDQNGQFDLVLSPVAAENDTRTTEIDSNTPIIRVVNLTDLEQRLQNQPVVHAMAPRWTLPVNVSTMDNPTQDYRAIGLALDSHKEKEQGFGDHLETIDLQEGECWITTSLASLLQLNVGDDILLKANLLTTLAEDGAMSVDGNSQENTIARVLAQKLIENSYNNSNGSVINLNNNNGSSQNTLVNDGIELVRSSIRQSTRNNGTIDANLFNAALLTAGVITTPIPSDTINNVPAADVETLLNIAEANNDNNLTFSVEKAVLINYLTPLVIRALNISKPYKIIQTISEPEGKWQSGLGNVIVIDSKYIKWTLMDAFYQVLNDTQADTGNQLINNLLTNLINNQDFNERVTESFESIDINEYALSVNVLLNDREDIYTSQEDIRPNLVKATDKIFSYLGLDYPVTVSSPLSDTLKNFFLFKNFLDNTFIAVVFILTILAILLIYSLMNTNVDEKKYEFGMLRVLGIKRYDLIGLMVIQSLFFAIPGLILGFALAYALNTIFSYVIFNYTLLKTSYTFPVSAIALGVSVGIVIPLASNIIPIRKALSSTLRDSLNAYSRNVNDINIHVAKLANLGISPAMAVGSLTLIILGFLGFYVAPYGYIMADMPLFFLILNIILLAMIIGLTLLANLIRNPFQKLVLFLLLLFFCKDKPLRTVIQKNTIAHDKRNSKTSLMFTLALAFLIFAGVGFKVNSNLITQQLQSTLGSDIVVTALSYETAFLKEAELRAALENFRVQKPAVIRDYAFMSQAFSLQPAVGLPKIMPLASYPQIDVDIISVDESYLRSVYEEFYISESLDPTVSVPRVPGSDYADGVSALYADFAVQTNATYDQDGVISQRNLTSYNLDMFVGPEVRVLISESVGKATSMKAGSTSIVMVEGIKFQGRVRNVAKKLPGFTFTGYKSTSQSVIVVSHEDHKTIRDYVWNRKANSSAGLGDTIAYNASIPANSTYDIPKMGLVVRINEDIDKEDRTALFNIIQTLVDGKFTFVTDVKGMIDTFEDALFFTDVFFVLISVIAIILTFFFTLVAFVGNIGENLWEFGVLRAVGLTRSQMTRTYIYEAVSLILSAVILGTAAGIVLAVIITVQFNLFTELPFKLIFPVTVFVITVVASLLIAVVGPRAAVRQVKYKQISSIIKALD